MHWLPQGRAISATEWLRLTLGFPEVPLSVLGNPPPGWSSPLRAFGDFRGLTFGPVGLRVACLLHLHSALCAFGTCMHCAAVGSRPFDRRLEPPLFIMARVSTKFLLRPPYTRLWDRIPRVLWDTLADESFSPRQTDGELLVLMCLRHGTAEEGRKLGGEPAAPGTLGHSGRARRPSGPDGLLQRPGGVGGGQASPASVRGGPGRPMG